MIVQKILLSFIVAILPISIAYAEEPIELSEYIENLRQQFVKLNEGTGKDKLPIYISPISVELSVQVAKKGSAGVKFYVVDVGGSAESASTQKLSFTVSIGEPNAPYLTRKYDPLGIFGDRAVIVAPQLRRPDEG